MTGFLLYGVDEEAVDERPFGCEPLVDRLP
ncbi:hypothetical protein GGR46_001487 [Sphingomonas kyeonggiensis]|uniref:Uncharacterized protein n=1 Tax=Sphingomonas kyeonggiensis TaxID=1268553 RepID=A0A7W6NVD0_9SPHN|nr:hypothetical protein [Sphingomonas kyeonggiensis]